MLNSNNLKCIAIICMIIDHIGYFFQSNMDYNLYILCRSIGRIAMPLFVFLLVEGFFYTKNLKKYILRVFIVAIIAQTIIYFLNYIDFKYFLDKVQDINNLNILFSFTLILILLRVIDRNVINNKRMDIFLRSLILIFIMIVYLVIDIDYTIYGALIALTYYIFKKIDIKKIPFIKYLVQAVLIMIFSVFAINNLVGVAVIFSNIFILLYNNNKGKKGKLVSLLFYNIFPLQYVLLYVVKWLI